MRGACGKEKSCDLRGDDAVGDTVKGSQSSPFYGFCYPKRPRAKRSNNDGISVEPSPHNVPSIRFPLLVEKQCRVAPSLNSPALN